MLVTSWSEISAYSHHWMCRKYPLRSPVLYSPHSLRVMYLRSPNPFVLEVLRVLVHLFVVITFPLSLSGRIAYDSVSPGCIVSL